MTEDLWITWAKRWNTFQAGYVPFRDDQFQITLSYLRDIVPTRPRVLDLCCGPGCISKLALSIPGALTMGIDKNAWLIEIARRTTDPTRASWLAADLTCLDWSELLTTYDAAIIATAAIWFDEEELLKIYGETARCLTVGAPLFIADLIPDIGADIPIGRLPINRVLAAQTRAATGSESWMAFWSAARREQAFSQWFSGSEESALQKDRPFLTTSDHASLLRDAGFGDVMQIWRRDASAILLATRSVNVVDQAFPAENLREH